MSQFHCNGRVHKLSVWIVTTIYKMWLVYQLYIKKKNLVYKTKIKLRTWLSIIEPFNTCLKTITIYIFLNYPIFLVKPKYFLVWFKSLNILWIHVLTIKCHWLIIVGGTELQKSFRNSKFIWILIYVIWVFFFLNNFFVLIFIF